MKKGIKIVSITTAALIAITIFTGCGPHRNDPPEKKIDKGFEFFADKLDFTDAQEKKLDKVRDEVKAELAKHKGLHEKTHGEAVKLLEKDTITKEDVMAIFEEHKKVRDEMAPFFAEKIAEVHAIMTPEQRKEVAEHLKDKGGKKGRRGPGFF